MTRLIISHNQQTKGTVKAWDVMNAESKANVLRIMRKLKNYDWTSPDVVELESSKEIKRIMENNSDFKEVR
jgi:hypothetical protein